MTKRSRARRTEDKEQRRADILDAAERAIARHGMTNITFGHVAKLSRLSRSLIYVYFPTHEDLIYAVCERALLELRARLEAALPPEATGLAQIMAMAGAYQVFSEENALYFKVISELEAKETKPKGMRGPEQKATDCGRQVLGLVAETVRRGVRDGSVRSQSGDPMLTALSVWAFTHGLIQISSSKRHMLEDDFGLSAPRLIQHGFTVLREALARPAGRTARRGGSRKKR